VVGQCRLFLTVRRVDLEYIIGEPLTQDLITRWADHVAEFSLAGIHMVGRKSG
jgi:hypothetical protein